MPTVSPLVAPLATLALVLSAAFVATVGGSTGDSLSSDQAATPSALVAAPSGSTDAPSGSSLFGPPELKLEIGALVDTHESIHPPVTPGTTFSTPSGGSCTVGPNLLQVKESSRFDAVVSDPYHDYFYTSPDCSLGTPKSFDKAVWTLVRLRGDTGASVSSIKIGKQVFGILRVPVSNGYGRFPNLAGYRWVSGDGADHPSGERYCVLSTALGDSGVLCGDSLKFLEVPKGSRGAVVSRVNDSERSAYLIGFVSKISADGSAVVQKLPVRAYNLDMSDLSY